MNPLTPTPPWRLHFHPDFTPPETITSHPLLVDATTADDLCPTFHPVTREAHPLWLKVEHPNARLRSTPGPRFRVTSFSSLPGEFRTDDLEQALQNFWHHATIQYIPENTPESFQAWFRYLSHHLAWHPDEDFFDYIHVGTGDRLYTPQQAGPLNRAMKRGFQIFQRHGLDLYAAALDSLPPHVRPVARSVTPILDWQI